MAAPIILLCCAENISKTRLLKTIFTFAGFFCIFFLYLNWSRFTSWTTSFWASLVISLLLTIAVTCSVFLRCAAVLSFVQVLSPFGLFMTFISVSWMTLQASLGSFINNHRAGYEALKTNFSQELGISEEAELLLIETILGFIHYSVLVPYLCIFVYSLLYEITYESRTVYLNVEMPSYSKKSKDKKTCLYIMKRVLLVLTGMIFASTMVMFWVQRLTFLYTYAALKASSGDTTRLHEMSIGWLIFYLISCVVLTILTPFSNSVLKFRHTVIRKFFRVHSGVIECKGDHLYIAKSSDKRISLKTYKEYVRDMEKQEFEHISSRDKQETRKYKSSDSYDKVSGHVGKLNEADSPTKLLHESTKTLPEEMTERDNDHLEVLQNVSQFQNASDKFRKKKASKYLKDVNASLDISDRETKNSLHSYTGMVMGKTIPSARLDKGLKASCKKPVSLPLGKYNSSYKNRSTSDRGVKSRGTKLHGSKDSKCINMHLDNSKRERCPQFNTNLRAMKNSLVDEKRDTSVQCKYETYSMSSEDDSKYMED